VFREVRVRMRVVFRFVIFWECMMAFQSFEDLQVCRRGKELAIVVYKSLKDCRDFGCNVPPFQFPQTLPKAVNELQKILLDSFLSQSVPRLNCALRLILHATFQSLILKQPVRSSMKLNNSIECSAHSPPLFLYHQVKRDRT